jgi:hypothetical protein
VLELGKNRGDLRWLVDSTFAPPISLTRQTTIGRRSDPSSLALNVAGAEGLGYRPSSGAAGTSFWNDPKQHLTVVFMMQAPSQLFHYFPMLRNVVYAGLIELDK